MGVLFDVILDIIQREYSKKEPAWKKITLPPTDLAFLKKECATQSEFDAHNMRNSLFQKMVQGGATNITMKCDYGQVSAIFDNAEYAEYAEYAEHAQQQVPWGLWGRILRLYSDSKHTPHKPFKIFFLANTHLRKFPELKTAIQPIHINGGYTYPCNRETIIIYRAEDATRVLLHELQHSCCLDNHSKGVDAVEAETEAWAELLYAGMLSRGIPRQFKALLQTQSDWMRCQNDRVRKHIGDSKKFPWRYTVGKEDVWRRWNILQPLSKSMHCDSLRLTAPPSNLLKKQFGVPADSMIL